MTTTTATDPPTRTNTMTTITRIKSFVAVFTATLALAPALAQDTFPAKPIRIIVPYAAGGGADILARLVAQELTARVKQPVVVENKGGASNTLGMQVVATSDADGYTLGLATPVFV